ncbi:hypothetical protein ACWGJP_07015 [Microbacterium sp. NPDC055903]
MYVSPEIIAVVLSALGIVLSLGIAGFSGFAWVIRRIDGTDARLNNRIDSVEGTLTQRIDDVEDKLTRRIDSVEDKLTQRLDALAAEMTEVKIAVARLEGPPRRLYISEA